MVLQVHVRVRHHGCYSEDVVDGARLVHFASEEDHCLALLEAPNPHVLEDVHRALPIDENDLVDRGDDWLVTRCPCQDTPEVTPRIRGVGCTILYPVVDRDGHEHFTVLAPSRERVRVMVERIEEIGEVELERVADVPGNTLDVSIPMSSVTNRMTQRQLEALVAAIHAGYYDVPRRVSAEALAKRMGLARSTFREHLRKGERAIMGTFARLLIEHPALMTTDLKGPGRPMQDLSMEPP